MDSSTYETITGVALIAAVILVGSFSKGRSWLARVAIGIATLVVVAVASVVGKAVLNELLWQSDDYAWSKLREAAIHRSPPLADIFALDPGIEAELRRTLLPEMRKAKNAKDPKLPDIVADAAIRTFQKTVFPLAVHGSTEAVNAWGTAIVSVYRAMGALSPEMCGVFILSGVNRNPPNPQVDGAISGALRAIVAAYKSSDRKAYPLPSEAAVDAAYQDAVRLVQPPFRDADWTALGDIEKQPKPRVCDLMTRLFTAVEKLPTAAKATIYRNMMSLAGTK